MILHFPSSIGSFQYGIVDYMGFVGYNTEDLKEPSFPFPFSFSLQLSPALLQVMCCEELKDQIPSTLEWFCFPSLLFCSFFLSTDGIHLCRRIPCLIWDNVPKSVIAGIEYLVQCLPCNPLFNSPPVEISRAIQVTSHLSQFDHAGDSSGRLLNLDSFDYHPEEVVAGLKLILNRMVGAAKTLDCSLR